MKGAGGHGIEFFAAGPLMFLWVRCTEGLSCRMEDKGQDGFLKYADSSNLPFAVLRQGRTQSCKSLLSKAISEFMCIFQRSLTAPRTPHHYLTVRPSDSFWVPNRIPIHSIHTRGAVTPRITISFNWSYTGIAMLWLNMSAGAVAQGSGLGGFRDISSSLGLIVKGLLSAFI